MGSFWRAFAPIRAGFAGSATDERPGLMRYVIFDTETPVPHWPLTPPRKRADGRRRAEPDRHRPPDRRPASGDGAAGGPGRVTRAGGTGGSADGEGGSAPGPIGSRGGVISSGPCGASGPVTVDPDELVGYVGLDTEDRVDSGGLRDELAIAGTGHDAGMFPSLGDGAG